MYYFRRNQEGEWLEFKLSADEVSKVQDSGITIILKLYSKVKSIGEKLNITLPEWLFKLILDKLAPTYTELAQDAIADQQNKKKTAAPAA